MLSANFKPKRTAAASRGFLATAWLSCLSRDREILVKGAYATTGHQQ